jgi:hypothetical protein
MSFRASQKTPFELFYWVIRVSHDDLGSANGIRVNVRSPWPATGYVVFRDTLFFGQPSIHIGS